LYFSSPFKTATQKFVPFEDISAIFEPMKGSWMVR
jgi:hypothetical protein